MSGTFSATVTFEGTVDGTNWIAVRGTPLATGTVATTATAASIVMLPVAGLHSIRARVSTYASGNVTVVGRAVETAINPV